MPYTKQRLEHALKVFRRKPLSQIAGDFQSRNLAHNLRSYSLRSPQKVFYDYDGPTRRARGAAQESDDDYDPSEERRQLAAKRKKTAQKRKAEGEDDADKKIKRSKQDKIDASDSQSAYITLKFTSEKGKQLFANLASIYGTTNPHHRKDAEPEAALDYWTPVSAIGSFWEANYVSDTEQGWNNNNVEELTVGLRNGKVPNKQIAPARKSKSKNVPQSPSGEDSEGINENSFLLNAAPSAPDSQLQLELKRVKQVESSTDSAGVVSMPTHYAHPINYQATQMACHFCGNWRMGVVGLGKRVVSIFRNPSDPTKLEEVGDGFRAENHVPTEMCVTCGQERLRIAQCHAPVTEDQIRIVSDQAEPQFTLITLRSHTKQELDAYREELFNPEKRPVQFRDTKSKGKESLSSCSLCPLPAYWRCYKFQEGDTIDDRLTVKHDYKVTQETVNGKKRDVLCLDSDSDDDKETSLPAAKRLRLNDRTPTPIRFSPVMPAFFRSPKASGSGCGLKLCKYCKVFLEDECNGKLEEDKVLHFLDNIGNPDGNRFGARADVEFLFTGSDLEKVHARINHDHGMRT